jgi:hypothetical protein
MKGFIPRTALGLGLSLFTLAGCAAYRDIVDPCWPERYNSLARQSVNEATNAQANNGHALDQTVWNYHFEAKKNGEPGDELNPAGIEHLKYISRRRPAPDMHIYLATAQDIPGLAKMPPEKAIAERISLNDRRIATIKRYLAIQTGAAIAYNVEVHDPAEVYLDAQQIAGALPPGQPRPVTGAYQKLQSNFQGVLPDASGSSSSSSSSSSTTSSSSGGSSSGSSGSPR